MSDKGMGLTFMLGQVQVWLHFEPRDLWIGAYWNKEVEYTEVYICLLPTVPIRFLWINVATSTAVED